MSDKSDSEQATYEQLLQNNKFLTIRDLDIDAFADGVLAHRNGLTFYHNPHGPIDTLTVRRVSWSMGWNERALRK